MKTMDIEYDVAGTRYVGTLALEEGSDGKRPGILVAHEGPGLTELAKSFARRLAAEGYVAFAMDYHGEGRSPGMDVAMERITAHLADPSAIRAIAAAALKVLADQPQADATRLAAIGYCFGGTTVLELARSGADVKATIGFHSGLRTARPQDAINIRGKVLVQIGADDPIIPPDQRLAFEKEMTDAKVDWRMILYGGAGHSFTNPDVDALGRPGFAYNKVTDRRSWRAMMDFLAETFM
jgi:dienelactone hydrolase